MAVRLAGDDSRSPMITGGSAGPRAGAGEGGPPAGVPARVAPPLLRPQPPVEGPGLRELVEAAPDAGAEPGQERRAERRRLGDLRTADRDGELVGLQLQQQVVGARAAVGRE